MENIFLILIAVVVVLFVWLLWTRQHLLHHLHSFERREVLLRRDISKRRDIVPYLLESFRVQNEITPEWSKLLERRKAFHQVGLMDFDKEMEFEKLLLEFISAHNIPNVNYLEAEKDINALTRIIRESMMGWAEEHESFNRLRKRFPYSITSVMFGIRA